MVRLIVFATLLTFLWSCTASNNCGRTWYDAHKCLKSCSNNGDCANGERCFEAPCLGRSLPTPKYHAQYCGTDLRDSSRCTDPCRKGRDDECPSGQKCFASVRCDWKGPAYYCGPRWGAHKCKVRCSSGNDHQCPPGEECFRDQKCRR